MNIRKNSFNLLFLALSLLLIFPAYADKIYLKGGNFIEGKVIEDDSTGVLLAINQEKKGSSTSKISRAQIASLEIDIQEVKNPFDSLESKEKIFKKNNLIPDSTIFSDSKYGFYIEVYPFYYFSRRDTVRDEVLFSSSKGEALMIGVFPCRPAEKKVLLLSYVRTLGVTPGMDKKVHWQGMDVYRKDSRELRGKIKIARSEYLLFPVNRDDFGVSLIFAYPENLGAEKAQQNINIVNTACVKPGGPIDLWSRIKSFFTKGK
jgi:hypothetical protein